MLRLIFVVLSPPLLFDGLTPLLPSRVSKCVGNNHTRYGIMKTLADLGYEVVADQSCLDVEQRQLV